MSENKADQLREALALARKRIEYLGSCGLNERHQTANETYFFPIIDAALAAPQPAAPLGGRREAIAWIIHPVGFDEDSMERISVVAAHRKEALAKADAILAILAIPQERGVERSAIIEECAKVIEQYQERISETSNGSERSVSPRMPGNLMGLAYVDAIRALAGKETGR